MAPKETTTTNYNNNVSLPHTYQVYPKKHIIRTNASDVPRSLQR